MSCIRLVYMFPTPTDTPQTPAQVILNSMNGLFQMSESATQHMLEAMEDIDIPDIWENVDLIKQTEGLMVCVCVRACVRACVRVCV